MKQALQKQPISFRWSLFISTGNEGKEAGSAIPPPPPSTTYTQYECPRTAVSHQPRAEKHLRQTHLKKALASCLPGARPCSERLGLWSRSLQMGHRGTSPKSLGAEDPGQVQLGSEACWACRAAGQPTPAFISSLSVPGQSGEGGGGTGGGWGAPLPGWQASLPPPHLGACPAVLAQSWNRSSVAQQTAGASPRLCPWGAPHPQLTLAHLTCHLCLRCGPLCQHGPGTPKGHDFWGSLGVLPGGVSTERGCRRAGAVPRPEQNTRGQRRMRPPPAPPPELGRLLAPPPALRLWFTASLGLRPPDSGWMTSPNWPSWAASVPTAGHSQPCNHASHFLPGQA